MLYSKNCIEIKLTNLNKKTSGNLNKLTYLCYIIKNKIINSERMVGTKFATNVDLWNCVARMLKQKTNYLLSFLI